MSSANVAVTHEYHFRCPDMRLTKTSFDVRYEWALVLTQVLRASWFLPQRAAVSAFPNEDSRLPVIDVASFDTLRENELPARRTTLFQSVKKVTHLNAPESCRGIVDTRLALGLHQHYCVPRYHVLAQLLALPD